jgi:hypothetical protein
VAELSAAAVSDFAVFDMIARAAIAIDASAKFFSPGSSLHRFSADFAIANFTDA